MAGAVAPSQPGAGGGSPEPPSVQTIATAFPHLEIAELIGAGGMGAVYKARQPTPGPIGSPEDPAESLAADPLSPSGSTAKAMLARLNHPGIVAVYDFGQTGGFFYLLMEYVDGVNLRDAIRRDVSPRQALACAPDLRGAPIRARRRHPTPRHQAGEHPDGQERAGEDCRLRDRQVLGGAARSHG